MKNNSMIIKFLVGASEGGHFQLVQNTLKNFEDNIYYPGLNSAILDAIGSAAKQGNEKIMLYLRDILLSRDRSNQYVDQIFDTILINAAAGGKINIMNNFFNELVVFSQETIIFCIDEAIKNDHIEVIEYLAGAFPEENIINIGLDYAVYHGQLELFEELWSRGATSFYGPFISAVTNEDYFLVDQCLIFAPLDQKIEWINSGLIICAQSFSKSISMMNYMISLGANNLDDALIEAIDCNNFNKIAFLIARGATDLEDGLWLASKNGYMEIVEYFILIEPNLDLDMALQSAVIGEQIQMIDKLISLGASNLDESFIIASHNGYNEGILYLFERMNSNVNQITLENALIEAIMHHHPTTISYLLNCGAKDLKGGLMISVENNNMMLVELFVDKGANNFYDAAKLAIDKTNLQIIQFLCQFMSKQEIKSLYSIAIKMNRRISAQYLKSIF